jgi:prephenate dehydratase
VVINNSDREIKRIAYCAGMTPEDYKAASSLKQGAVRVDFPNYRQTYEAVLSGDCDVCVMPFENSRNGQVPMVMNLFYEGDLSIIKVFKWETDTETVRYAVLSRDENQTGCEEGSRFMMSFTLKNIQGTLVKAINAISSHGFNIRFLHTRPNEEEDWGYYFFIECDGDDTTEEGQAMLADLKAASETFKFIGRYPSK